MTTLEVPAPPPEIAIAPATELGRKIAYIDRELARADREPGDIKLLRERRAQLLERRR